MRSSGLAIAEQSTCRVLVPRRMKPRTCRSSWSRPLPPSRPIATHVTRSSSSTTARRTTRGPCCETLAARYRLPASSSGIAAQRGIADALRTGFLHARGQVLVFYPADLQYKPEDIPRLVAPILAGDADMVTGFKQGEYEKAFVSRVYNWLSRALFKRARCAI